MAMQLDDLGKGLEPLAVQATDAARASLLVEVQCRLEDLGTVSLGSRLCDHDTHFPGGSCVTTIIVI
jgi:hypothetical protein